MPGKRILVNTRCLNDDCSKEELQLRRADNLKLQKSVKVESCGMWDIGVSENNTYIAVGCGNGTSRLYDARRGSLISTFIGHEEDVTAVSVSSDGKYLVTGARDATARVWKADGARRCRARLIR